MTLNANAVDIHLTMGVSETFRVVACRLTEGISKLTHAELELASLEDIDLEGSLQSDAKLSLHFGGIPLREWTLRVGKGRFVGIRDGALRYHIDLHPHLWLLQFSKNTRKFRNMSAKDIISKVLGENQVAHEWRTTRQPPTRKYCVQYRETNLDFVLRLLEFEGVYYTFESDGTLILEDNSAAADRIAGLSHFELIEAAGALDRGELGLHEFRKCAKVMPGKATVNDFNWKKPRLNLIQSKAAALDTELETYHYPTGFRNPKDGAYLAQIRLEAQRVPSKTVGGKGVVPTFAPCRKFNFGGIASAMFAGEYLLTEITHFAHNTVYGEVVTLPGGHVYENHFKAIPSNVPFRSPWTIPRPTIAGVHTAMVRGPAGEEIHTDKYGRFRAQFHWDREAKSTDEDSRWIRPLQETATSMVLARVGWEMSIAYIEGDPDRPVGIARKINGIMAPTYSQPSKKNVMSIKTPTYPKNGGYNEVRLDDSAGSMSFFMHAERDITHITLHDKTERIGSNETHTIGGSRTHNVKNDQSVKIGGDSKTTCANDYRMDIVKNRSISVGGDETIDVGATATVTAMNNDSETVGSNRITLAGLSGEGSISRTTEKNMIRMIGGAHITCATENISLAVKKNYMELIAGIKYTQTSKGGINQIVAGEKVLNVEGSVMRCSTKDMGIGTENGIVNVNVNASLKSDERLEFRANEVVLEAKSSFEFKSKDLEIKLTPEKAALKGSVLIKAGSKLIVTGGPDNITS